MGDNKHTQCCVTAEQGLKAQSELPRSCKSREGASEEEREHRGSGEGRGCAELYEKGGSDKLKPKPGG